MEMRDKKTIIKKGVKQGCAFLHTLYACIQCALNKVTKGMEIGITMKNNKKHNDLHLTLQ